MKEALSKKNQNIKNPIIRKRYLKYSKLPPKLKSLMFSPETAQEIEAIAQNNNLNQKQSWWMSYVIGMILLGETHIVDFLKTLQAKCELEKEKARELAKDINREIFLPVKNDLKEIHQVNRWPREEEAQEGQKVEKPEEPEENREEDEEIEEKDKE